MAYKQSPLTMIQGTAGHKSALKAVSPLKQTEELDLWKKMRSMKKAFSKTIYGEGTRQFVKSASQKASELTFKNIVKKSGGKALATLGMYFGSMGTAKATQPGTGDHGGKKVQLLKDIDKPK